MSSCLVTIKRFTRSCGFSGRVAQQVSLARRPSSRAGYQSMWLVFRQWCRSEGHSISLPSLPKIADFLYQYLLLWAMGPCCLQFLNRFCRRFLYLCCFMFCCGHFRQRHRVGRLSSFRGSEYCLIFFYDPRLFSRGQLFHYGI